MVVDDVRRMLLSFKGICRSQMLMHQGLNLDRTPGSLGTMMKIKTAFSIVGKVSKTISELLTSRLLAWRLALLDSMVHTHVDLDLEQNNNQHMNFVCKCSIYGLV